MPRNEGFSKINFEKLQVVDGKITDESWHKFLVALSNMDIRSGLNSVDTPTNLGYVLGYDSSGLPILKIGDYSDAKYFEFDGADIQIGRNSKMRGADAFNNDHIYLHEWFRTIDNVVTSGTVALNNSGYLRITNDGYAYMAKDHELSEFTFDEGTVRIKTKMHQSGSVGTPQYYVMTGTRLSGSSGFGFFQDNGAAYGVSRKSGTDHNTALTSTNIMDAVLEAVLYAGEKIEYYVNGTLQATNSTVSQLPIDESAKSSSQGALWFIQNDNSSLNLEVGEFILLHEKA